MPVHWTISHASRLVVAVAKDQMTASDIEKYFAAITADEAYELGRTMATVGAYGLIDKPAPAFSVAPAITVTKDNVVEGWKTSLNREPPQSILDALK